jgi:hypothetical protein
MREVSLDNSTIDERWHSHPLGAHESWPASGPVYGLDEADDDAQPAIRLSGHRPGSVFRAEVMRLAPGTFPVWY